MVRGDGSARLPIRTQHVVSETPIARGKPACSLRLVEIYSDRGQTLLPKYQMGKKWKFNLDRLSGGERTLVRSLFFVNGKIQKCGARSNKSPRPAVNMKMPRACTVENHVLSLVAANLILHGASPWYQLLNLA